MLTAGLTVSEGEDVRTVWIVRRISTVRISGILTTSPEAGLGPPRLGLTSCPQATQRQSFHLKTASQVRLPPLDSKLAHIQHSSHEAV